MGKRSSNPSETWMLIELRMAVISHCYALKAVTRFLEEDKKAAAVARLDGDVHALHAIVRGQCAGVTMKCPHCQAPVDVVAWAEEQTCPACGETLEIPKSGEGGK